MIVGHRIYRAGIMLRGKSCRCDNLNHTICMRAVILKPHYFKTTSCKHVRQTDLPTNFCEMHNGANKPESKTTCTFRRVRQVAAPGAKYTVSDRILCKNMTSSTKPEVHNALHCHHRRNETRPRLTWMIAILRNFTPLPSLSSIYSTRPLTLSCLYGTCMFSHFGTTREAEDDDRT